MSEREFERYLRLLGQLLELDESQREAVAAELRDHMEQRLDELTARGVEREEAIRMALDEFGDAAGLAGSLTRVGRAQIIRRRIMQTGIGTLTAAAAIVLGVVFLLPENRPGVPSVAQIHADAEQEAARPSDESRPAQPFVVAEDRADRDPAWQMLQRRVDDVSIVDRPLEEVLAFVRESTGANIHVHWRSLEDLGVRRDEPVTLERLHDVTAEAMLALALETVDPTGARLVSFTIRDNIIRVGGPEVLTPKVRAYETRHLISAAVSAADEDPADRLISLLNLLNEQLSARWPDDAVSLSIFDGLLFVQGRQEHHEHVARVLEMARQAQARRGERAADGPREASEASEQRPREVTVSEAPRGAALQRQSEQVQQLLVRACELQKELEYERALELVEHALFFEPDHVGGLAMREMIQDAMAYREERARVRDEE